jgi:hypothetical protein
MQTSNTALRKNDFEFATHLHLLPGEFAVNGHVALKRSA